MALVPRTGSHVRFTLLRSYQRISICLRQLSPFRKTASFNLRIVRTSPKPQVGEPLLTVSDCSFNTFAATLHAGRPFLLSQPAEAPCRGAREQLITVHKRMLLNFRMILLINFLCVIQNYINKQAIYVFLMKPNRCTLLFHKFISTSLHVSCKYAPIIRRTYCIYATLLFLLSMGGCPVCRPDSHLIRVE